MADSEEPQWGQLFSAGLQVLVGVGLGAFVGNWLDQKYGWAPWGVIIGCLLGVAGGMYLLIKETISSSKK